MITGAELFFLTIGVGSICTVFYAAITVAISWDLKKNG